MSDLSASADVRRVAEEAMVAFKIPGLAIVAVHGGTPAGAWYLGTDANGAALTSDSIFPVASITKLATALAVLRLVDAGAIDLDDPLARAVPDAAAAQPGVSIRALLSHQSGLPLDVADEATLYAPGLDWPRLATACLQTPLQRAPGARVQYSNVGYGLLAIVVERLAGQTVATALGALVSRPLGIEAFLGVEPPRPPVVLADVRGPFVGTPMAPYNTPFWRSLALPWSGLLTTTAGALGLIRAFQGDPVGFLTLETLVAATRNQTDDL
ncbi:MAG: serine hydrolase domain-containing protein, partial [Candidatus Dormibacteraceae bacterium]